MLVYNQDSNKIILCSGEHGKFVILTNHAPPVLVTFTSSILGVELFVNKAGLTCALVRRVYIGDYVTVTVLDLVSLL